MDTHCSPMPAAAPRYCAPEVEEELRRRVAEAHGEAGAGNDTGAVAGRFAVRMRRSENDGSRPGPDGDVRAGRGGSAAG